MKKCRRDWLCEFQNVNPADGCCVAIGFLSSGALCHFRLHDDDATASIQKERRKTGKYLSWREQWKLNINSSSVWKDCLCGRITDDRSQVSIDG